MKPSRIIKRKIEKQLVTVPLRKAFNAEWNKNGMLKGNQSSHDNDDIGLIPVKSRHKTNNRICTADDSVQCRHCLAIP